MSAIWNVSRLLPGNLGVDADRPELAGSSISTHGGDRLLTVCGNTADGCPATAEANPNGPNLLLLERCLLSDKLALVPRAVLTNAPTPREMTNGTSSFASSRIVG